MSVSQYYLTTLFILFVVHEYIIYTKKYILSIYERLIKSFGDNLEMAAK